MDGDASIAEYENIFSIPPKFSTLRMNGLANDYQSIENELKHYIQERWLACGVSRHPVLPELLVVRSAGRLPVQSAHRPLIVDALCGAAVLRGADVYAPGVLACPADVREGEPVSIFADLEGRCLRGRTQPYDGRRLFVGNGVMQLSRRVIFTADKPSGVGVRVTEPVFGCPSLGAVCGRRLMLQNLPSAVAARVLDPRPGELVVDMCAAPGGKTTHIAQLMGNKGLVYAFDKTAAKVSRIVSLCAEQAVTCVVALRGDSTRLVSASSPCRLRARHLTGAACPAHPSGPCRPPWPPGTFDRALLDAPCSGLGQRPRLAEPPAAAQLASYPPLQARLLRSSAELLRPGGRLVYSTCSTPPEENEKQVSALLAERRDLALLPAEPRLGGPGRSGEGLTEQQCRMVQRFAPDPHSDSPDADTIGFFIACFSKLQDS